ncbi:DUF4148 domain-containing protein [Trinickia mobilis]|uniref:DUF4148 domain-containing protein n=1 Tax=Trinickia mobilis TaxID=2816356 RepID=UPI001A8C3ECA|nr:DUF4148 domain-containing protein [Trinickia mobilis]
MKSLVQAVVVAAVLSAPVVSFAQQSNAPVTRAQVRAELVQLERAGYNPSSDQTQYPKNIEAAEARVAAQNGAASGYGGGVSGSSQSAGRSGVSAADWNAMYNHP